MLRVLFSSARRPRGARDSDDPFIASILTTALLCGDCIACKVGVPPWRINGALDRLARTVNVTNEVALCDAGLKQAVVHQLG